MMFQSFSSIATALTLVTGLAGSTFAAPATDPADLSRRQGGNYNAQNPLYTVYPAVISQYTVSTGAVNFNTYHGLIDKHTNNKGADITSLVSFTVPDAYASNTCEVVFDLTASWPAAIATGTAGAQIFCSLAPATATTSTWPQGNQRNNYLGTLKAVVGGRATWDLPTTSRQFPCQEFTSGRLFGGEIVPTGDNDHIEWSPAVDGLKIVIY